MSGKLTIIVGPAGSGKTTGAQKLFIEQAGYHPVILEDLDTDPGFTVPEWAMEVLAGGGNVVATSSTVVLEDALRAQGITYMLIHPSVYFADVAMMLGAYPPSEEDEEWEIVAETAVEAAGVLRALTQPLNRPEVLGG